MFRAVFFLDFIVKIFLIGLCFFLIPGFVSVDVQMELSVKTFGVCRFYSVTLI